MPDELVPLEEHLVTPDELDAIDAIQMTEEKLMDKQKLQIFKGWVNRKYKCYKFVYKMIFKDRRTCLIVIVGERGTGKSWCGLKLLQDLDYDFAHGDPDTMIRSRVVVNPKDYIHLINSGDLHRGSVIMFDEAGVGIPAREWQTINNKAISYLTQVFRHKGLIVIFTVPSWDYIDVHIREAINLRITTLRVDRKEKKVICKVQRVKKNEIKRPPADITFTYLKYKNMRLFRTKFKRVAKPIAKAYEKYSKEFKERIEHGLETTLDKAAARAGMDDKPKINLQELVNKVVASRQEYSKITKNKVELSNILIEAKLGVSQKEAAKIRVLANEQLKKLGIVGEDVKI